MKKLLAALVLTVAFGASVSAWEIISFGVTETQPYDAAHNTVCGVKVGVPISGGPAPVYGVEGAIFWAATREVDGIQCSFIGTGGDEVNGLQFALVNLARRVSGLQLGLFNSAAEKSFQIGLLNHIEGGAIPWMPIINFKF